MCLKWLQRVYLQHNAKGCAAFISLYDHKSHYTLKKGSYEVMYKLSGKATQNYSRKDYYNTFKKVILYVAELACSESFKKVGEVVSQPDLFQLHGNHQDQVETPHM